MEAHMRVLAESGRVPLDFHDSEATACVGLARTDSSENRQANNGDDSRDGRTREGVAGAADA